MKSSYKVQLIILGIAVISALLVGAVLLLIVRANPFTAYRAMLLGPFSSLYGLTETAAKATPLMLVGLGIVIAFRSGILNIGGEGQMIIGALVGTVVAITLQNWSPLILLPLTMLAGFLGGALYGAIPGALRAYFKVNEILSTIMLNAIAQQILVFLLRGPLIDPTEIAYGTGFPQTQQLAKAIWLGKLIPQTRLHWGFIVAIVLAVAVYFFLWRTVIGYRLRAVGAGPQAARSAGIAVERGLITAMALSGGFAGLAGIVEVLGIHHRLLDGVSAGYGFTGIVAALFGRLHPIGLIPASFLFGALVLGADMMQRAVAIPAAIVLTIQGIMVLFVVGSDIFIRRPEWVEKVTGPLRGKTPPAVEVAGIASDQGGPPGD
ncbi:MAG: ABC transporter permease [Anaerolineales bacterium]